MAKGRSSVSVVTILVLGALALGCLISLGPAAAQKSNRTVSVLALDGIRFLANSVFENVDEDAFERDLPYLEPALRGAWGSFASVLTVPWSGDVTDTEDTLTLIKAFLPVLARNAKKKSQTFVVVGHSWGTLLAYRAIKELAAEGAIKAGDVDQLVTLGSPLTSQKPIIKGNMEKYSDWVGADPIINAVREWRNYVIKEDIIATVISGLDDVENGKNIELPLHTGVIPNKIFAHRQYYENQLFIGTLGLHIRQSIETANQTVAENAPSVDPPVHDCDTLAADPHDGDRVAEGVSARKLTEHSIEACKDAVSQFPGVGRFEYQYARALSGVRSWGFQHAEVRIIMRKAAERNYAIAANWLSGVYSTEYMTKGLPEAGLEAAKWLLVAAEQGHADAQVTLGYAYEMGRRSVPQDRDKALEWYEKAAAQKYASAFHRLADFHERLGNYDAAARWYQELINGEFMLQRPAGNIDILASIGREGLEKLQAKIQQQKIEQEKKQTALAEAKRQKETQKSEWEKKQAQEFSHRDGKTPVPTVMELTSETAYKLIKHATRFPEPVADSFQNIKKRTPLGREVERMIREGYFVCKQSILGDFSATKNGKYLVENCIWNSFYKYYMVDFYTHKLEITRIVDILTDKSIGTAVVTYEVGLAEAPYLERLREIDLARVQREFGGRDIKSVRELRKVSLKKWDQGWRVRH